MTWLLVQRIMVHAWLARICPVDYAHIFDDMAYGLASKASKAKPMKKPWRSTKKPWLGEATCFNIDCRHKWTVFAPSGIDPEIDLECPACGQDTGALS